MMKTKIERVKTSLEIEEDIDIHIKGWIAQRIGWIVMLVFLALAGLGLFGDGPLSDETLTDGEATLTYEKYVRRENDAEFEIAAPARNGKVQVALSGAFMDTYKIEAIVPEPEKQSMSDGDMVLDFPAAGEWHLVLYTTVRKHESGKSSSRVRINGSDFELHNYIYF